MWSFIKRVYQVICDLVLGILLVFKNFHDYWFQKYNDSEPIFNPDNFNISTEDEIFDPIDQYVITEPEIEHEDELTAMEFKLRNMVIYQLIKRDKCVIKINPQKMNISEIQSITLESNKYCNIIMKDSLIGCMSTVKLFGKTYNVTCNHAMSLLDLAEIAQYNQLNPHIVINGKITTNQTPVWVVKEKSMIGWYTKEITANKYVYIELEVQRSIDLVIKVNGRQKVGTLAIVVSIQYSPQYVYSGTLMLVGNKPYIVTYTNNNEEAAVTHIVALACIKHDYEIIVND